MHAPRKLRTSLLFAALAAHLAVAPLVRSAAEPDRICWGIEATLRLPDWVRSTTIYEINVRQYSESGTFAAVEADLPRLRELGVGILWFMPIHPIGEVNRKGELGSYYAVRDYVGVSPEFGTPEDFRRLVKAAHAMGFRVIMDWVANHAAWDNTLVKSHPEFFMTDHTGTFIPPIGFDWTDVIQLDYGKRAVWDYQIESMAHWVREFDVDGFRCDYTTGVPTAFWNVMSEKLRALRDDIFLLAEGEVPQQQLRAFHASYTFSLLHTMNEVAQGHAPATGIDTQWNRYRIKFPAGAHFLNYTLNHDVNSWEGTELERLGGGAKTFAVLTFVTDGIPLVYNGQEVGLDRRLLFFERDPIRWGPHSMTDFYRTLIRLKREHPALATGAAAIRIPTTEDQAIYGLAREAGDRRVVALLNLSAKDIEFTAAHAHLAGKWREVFSGETVDSADLLTLKLRSWEYRVFESAP